MKLPRDLYGRDLAAALCQLWGYHNAILRDVAVAKKTTSEAILASI